MGHLIWDYQIISYIVATIIALFLLIKNIKQKNLIDSPKKKKIKYLITSFLIIFLLTIIYGSYIEPRLIVVKNVDININKTQLHENIRIVQLSDLHAGPYKKETYFKKISKKIITLNPDIIVLTGDFIYNDPQTASYIKGLEKATNTFPTYAITGNHEYDLGFASDYEKNKMLDKTTILRKTLSEINVQFLDNQSLLINTNDGPLYLSGIKEVWSQPDIINNQLAKMSSQVSSKTPKILLAHNPEIINYKNHQLFDIILSGHTHGGQIRLPFLGSVSPLPTNLGRHYDRGLFETNQTTKLYINQGIGEAGPRARLFCPPEITLFNIDL